VAPARTSYIQFLYSRFVNRNRIRNIPLNTLNAKFVRCEYATMNGQTSASPTLAGLLSTFLSILSRLRTRSHRFSLAGLTFVIANVYSWNVVLLSQNVPFVLLLYLSIFIVAYISAQFYNASVCFCSIIFYYVLLSLFISPACVCLGRKNRLEKQTAAT